MTTRSERLPPCCHPGPDATLAEQLYCTYNAGGERPGLNYRDEPCPAWSDLPEDIQRKWKAAAELAGALFFEYGPEVVEGLLLDVSAEELRSHALFRAEHHDGRRDWYEARAVEIPDEEEPVAVTNSPRASLRASAKKHAQRASYLRFVAGHVFDGRVYRLGQSELASLEFIESRY